MYTHKCTQAFINHRHVYRIQYRARRQAKVLKVEEFGTELLEFALAIVTADSHDANGPQRENSKLLRD